MTDWITFRFVFGAILVIAVVLLAAVLVYRGLKSAGINPKPRTKTTTGGGSDKKDDRSSTTSSSSGTGGGGWKKVLGSLKGGFSLAMTAIKVVAVLILFYLGYLLLSWAWNEIKHPAAIRGPVSHSRGVNGTVSRAPLGTRCAKLSRDELQTCYVRSASDWTHFETGPQVAGFQVSILPDYDQDRQRPEKERAYRELHFLLDDGSDFRYEGQPPPRMAVAFRAAVNRPTEFIYKMERLPVQ